MKEMKKRLSKLRAQKRKIEDEMRKLGMEIEIAEQEEERRTGWPRSMPQTAEDWQLFTATRKCDGCAKRLTARLKKELLRFDRRVGNVGVKQAAVECQSRMMEKLDQESKYGASDTEPRTVMEQAILDFGRAKGLEMDPEWLW